MGGRACGGSQRCWAGTWRAATPDFGVVLLAACRCSPVDLQLAVRGRSAVVSVGACRSASMGGCLLELVAPWRLAKEPLLRQSPSRAALLQSTHPPQERAAPPQQADCCHERNWPRAASQTLHPNPKTVLSSTHLPADPHRVADAERRAVDTDLLEASGPVAELLSLHRPCHCCCSYSGTWQGPQLLQQCCSQHQAAAVGQTRRGRRRKQALRGRVLSCAPTHPPEEVHGCSRRGGTRRSWRSTSMSWRTAPCGSWTPCCARTGPRCRLLIDPLLPGSSMGPPDRYGPHAALQT